MKVFLVLTLFALVLTNCFAQPCVIGEPKTLILYYSQTGVTKKVAEALRKQLNADIEAIEVTKPYDGTYQDTISRCIAEMKSNELPHIRPLKSDLKKYDTLFIGYPIWFGTYARPVITLVNTFKFAGKQIIPFCTFGSGGLVESTEHMKKALPMAYVQEGFGIREARISKLNTELDRYLKLSGFIAGVAEIYPEFSEQKDLTPEDIKIFNDACSSYKMPLGTPISVGSRKTNNGIDYLFYTNGKMPDGREIKSKIYITVEKGNTPEFTLVVR